MLVLSRDLGEVIEITIPPDVERRTVTVKVLVIGRNRVKLGLDADVKIKIDRQEVAERCRNQASS